MFLDTNMDPRMVPDKPSLPNNKSMRNTGPAVKPGNYSSAL